MSIIDPWRFELGTRLSQPITSILCLKKRKKRKNKTKQNKGKEAFEIAKAYL